jgi:pyrroloquinoline quinone biosynthesis protein D
MRFALGDVGRNPREVEERRGNMTSLTEESRPKLARGVRLQADPMSGEPILLYPEGFLNLESNEHDILARCDGGKTLGEIVEELGEEYEVEPGELRGDVVEYLTQLRLEMLLTVA